MGIETQIALEAGLEYAIAVFDISKAFLRADFPEEAGNRRPIVRAPAEYVFKKIHSGRRGLRIRKALYGLRRSPNLFQGHFVVQWRTLISNLVRQTSTSMFSSL